MARIERGGGGGFSRMYSLFTERWAYYWGAGLISGEGRVKSGCSREAVLISLWYCFHAHLL